MGSPERDELVLNPKISLELHLTVRLRDRAYKILTPREHGPALRWLLPQVLDTENEATELSIADELLEAVQAAGLLVPADEIPELDEVALDRDLSEDVLALVPEQESPPERGRMITNPALWVQHDASLPAALRGRVYQPTANDLRYSEPSRSFPRIWVEDPRTKILSGYTCGGRWGELLRSVACDGAPLDTLDDGALRVLSLARIAVPAEPILEPAEDAATIETDGYRILRGAVPPLLAAALRDYYRRLRAAGYFGESALYPTPGCRAILNELESRYIQHQLIHALGRHLPGPIHATHSAVVSYEPGTVHELGTDREGTGWNVLLCAGAEPGGDRERAWPIHLSTSGGERTVRLAIGDALLHSSARVRPRRDPSPPGTLHTMCFLHYVDARYEGPLDE